jgi:hypothetical protein
MPIGAVDQAIAKAKAREHRTVKTVEELAARAAAGAGLPAAGGDTIFGLPKMVVLLGGAAAVVGVVLYMKKRKRGASGGTAGQ